jgi:hypothetical protein
MAVEASIVVQFIDSTTSETGNVIVELDPTHINNLDSDDELKSTFDPTDEPVFLVHHNDKVYVDSVACTYGSVVDLGDNKTREQEIEVFFSNDEEITISYSDPSLKSIEWYGNSCTFVIDGNVLTPNASGTFPCLGDAIFNVLYNKQYKLIPPSLTLGADETYKIIVVIYMGVL